MNLFKMGMVVLDVVCSIAKKVFVASYEQPIGLQETILRDNGLFGFVGTVVAETKQTEITTVPTEVSFRTI